MPDRHARQPVDVDPETSAGGEPGVPETVPMPMDGVLDLHTFRPRDAADVVAEFVAESRRQGLQRVRVVHGKGIGQLREIVHRQLDRHPDVLDYRLAGGAQGGWGATLVDLRPALRPGGKD